MGNNPEKDMVVNGHKFICLQYWPTTFMYMY